MATENTKVTQIQNGPVHMSMSFSSSEMTEHQEQIKLGNNAALGNGLTRGHWALGKVSQMLYPESLSGVCTAPDKFSVLLILVRDQIQNPAQNTRSGWRH